MEMDSLSFDQYLFITNMGIQSSALQFNYIGWRNKELQMQIGIVGAYCYNSEFSWDSICPGIFI